MISNILASIHVFVLARWASSWEQKAGPLYLQEGRRRILRASPTCSAPRTPLVNPQGTSVRTLSVTQYFRKGSARVEVFLQGQPASKCWIRFWTQVPQSPSTYPVFVCVCSVVFDSLQPHGLQPTKFFCPWDSPGQILQWVPFPSPGDLPRPRIKPTSPVSPALVGRFFTTEPPGKP